MSVTLHNHIRESVLKTALLHQLKNGQKSPERAARNMEELLLRFQPGSMEQFHYTDLLSMIKSCTLEECLNLIMKKLSDSRSAWWH